MPSFEVIYTFDDGRGAAVARLDAENFEDAAGLALVRVPGRRVKRLELTDLASEDAEAEEAGDAE